ncbi:hypothetical protein F5I97DRAFT_2074409 [Phlebopus sp. FC_14]|nr:hypothetical protein F5I97DRAFT_2074409 [Phlebopus sp. FC_14]
MLNSWPWFREAIRWTRSGKSLKASRNAGAGCFVLKAGYIQVNRLELTGLVGDTVFDENASSVSWTIVNKYYKANVQFVVHQLSTWAANREEVVGVPAVVFVWSVGELLPQEFESLLAVRLPPTSPSSDFEAEDEQDIDSYLSSLGFEFVDVLACDSAPASDRTGDAGVHRIIDALSTIMWPSMIQHSSKRTSKSFDMTRGSMTSDTTLHLSRLLGTNLPHGRDDRIQRELEELEQWLGEDTTGEHRDTGFNGEDEATDPWSTAVTAGTNTPYSRSEIHTSSRPTTPKAGFDDDFTSFVSASLSSTVSISSAQRSSPGPSAGRKVPLVSTSFSSTFSFSTSSGQTTPAHEHEQESFDMSRLTPGDTGFEISYRSLGSVSDFGDVDGERSFHDHRLDDSGDEDMPSKAEIVETSRRIFGSVPLSLSPTDERGTHQAMRPKLLSDVEAKIDDEMTDDDLERFDLQGMLSALQGLKEEIAGMPDKERRKAAARVALGLAYGLEDKTQGKNQT